MRRMIIAVLALVLGLGFSLNVYAETRDKDRAEPMSGYFKANEIIGAKVENRQGDNLGKITDLAVDPSSSRVDFAVLSHGGVLGIGDKYIAVPLSAFTVKRDNNGKVDKFVLDMSKDKLAQAPNFDKDHWPNRTDADRTYRYFGQNAYWNERTSARDMDRTEYMSGTFKANEIIGAKVENRQGDNLGKITDLAIDPSGRIDFAVLSHGGVLGIGDKYIAVPMRAFMVKREDNGKLDKFVLDMSKDKLAQAPNFDKDHWPNRADAEKTYRYFGQTPSWGDRSKR